MHFRILDNWRIGAAVLVMVFHFLSYGPASALAASERLYSLLPLMDMFLMISGFLIMLRYRETLLLERGSYAKFISRRLFRFYPLYFVTLVYFVIVGIAVNAGLIGSDADGRYDFAALPANILLLQGWGVTHVLTFNYVGWTLSAEWFCYLTLPVIVLVQRHFGLRGLLALVVATILALEAAVSTGIMPVSSWLVADTFGAYRAFADFSIGACLAVAIGICPWRLHSHAVGWSTFALTIVLMWNGLAGYGTLAMLALSIFLAALAERTNPDGSRPLRVFDPVAAASFSIYLIHPVFASLLLGLLWRRLIEPTGAVNFYAFMVFPMAVVVVVAVLSTHYFEAPLSKALNARFGHFGQPRSKLARAG